MNSRVEWFLELTFSLRIIRPSKFGNEALLRHFNYLLFFIGV